MSSISPTIYTLTNLTRSLENHFDKTFGTRTYWVKAELSKVNVSSGRRYIELVDSENENVSAKIQAIIWANTYSTIFKKAGKVIESIIQPGNKVLIEVKIQYDKIYGLKLLIVDLDLSFSFGDVEKLKKETIAKLKKEQIFNDQKSVYLPVISKRIALIGSIDTSGYKDFVTELSTNNYYRNFAVKVFDTKVQGKAAIPQIIKAINSANQYDVDVIVILRGGGSKIDLNIFNDYSLCKAICDSRLPVLTGIGHETDEVVADLVARKSLITPTALAKSLYLSIATFNTNLVHSYKAITVATNTQLRNKKEEFERTKKDVSIYSTNILNEASQQLSTISHNISSKLNNLLRDHSEQLTDIKHNISSKLTTLLRDNSEYLNHNFDKIKILSFDFIKHQEVDLNSKLKMLELLNPKRLLDSGYSISTVENKEIKEIKNLVGKELKTLTDKGTIYSTITKINKPNQ